MNSPFSLEEQENFFKSVELNDNGQMILKAKGKKDPIGTIRNGMKKVAEGKWVQVKKEGSGGKPAMDKQKELKDLQPKDSEDKESNFLEVYGFGRGGEGDPTARTIAKKYGLRIEKTDQGREGDRLYRIYGDKKTLSKIQNEDLGGKGRLEKNNKKENVKSELEREYKKYISMALGGDKDKIEKFMSHIKEEHGEGWSKKWDNYVPSYIINLVKRTYNSL